MDSMELTKIGGALCGALLTCLLFVWAAEVIYSTRHAGHGDGHGGEKYAWAYPIEVEGPDGVEEVEQGPTFEELFAAADAARGERIFNKCKSCHSVVAGENGAGPYVAQVVGRPVGSVDGFNYSGAMAEFGGNWTPENLDAFLENPRGYIAGTSMGFSGLKKPEDRVNVIAYLQSLQ
ncbi:MAG: cytochrome c family protein [Rhodobacteraceae bacterium]|nr:cytochrome c family protein [Paracoccaceae bacterium]